MAEKKQAAPVSADAPRQRHRPARAPEASYWIVNPAGAIHQVTREHARVRLAQPGWRLAEQAEVDALRERGGYQVFDNPICARWSPEPPAVPEVV